MRVCVRVSADYVSRLVKAHLLLPIVSGKEQDEGDSSPPLSITGAGGGYRCIPCNCVVSTTEPALLRFHVNSERHKILLNSHLGLARSKQLVLQHDSWSHVKYRCVTAGGIMHTSCIHGNPMPYSRHSLTH